MIFASWIVQCASSRRLVLPITFPSLAKFALPAEGTLESYAPRLLFHLWSGGPYNQFLAHFSPVQRRAVCSLLEYIDSVADEQIDRDYLHQTIENWSRREA